MRQLTYILSFIVSTAFSACTQSKNTSNFEKSNIDNEMVDFIEIKNRAGQFDTLDNLKKRLTVEQKNQFIEKFNNSKPIGLGKSLPFYFIYVHLKDGTKRSFRINGQFIKENNDYCFDLRDGQFIEKIWNDLNIDHFVKPNNWGLISSLGYEFTIGKIKIEPSYSYFFGVSQEFNSLQASTSSMRHNVTLGIRY